MDRQLINYLPEWLRDFNEMKKLARAEQDQAEKLWKICESIWDNNFLDTLDLHGCDRWETMLHIKPKDSYSLAERRNNIKSRVVEQRPFTVKKLEQMLDSICGKERYELSIEPDKYKITCKIELTSKNMLNDTQELMRRVIPANMLMDIDLKYNTYAMLAEFTNKQLNTYTYKQLREEVM